MAGIGKAVRLGRIFNQRSKNSVMVAMDHAAVIGPVEGMVNAADTVKKLAAGKPNTFFMPIGALKHVYHLFIENEISFIASLDTCTKMGPEPDYFMLSDSVDHALNIGASAVSVHVLVGPEKTSEMIMGLSKVAIRCDELGMPLLAIMYPEGFSNNFDVKYVKWAARLGSELGADVVKTYFTGTRESFREVVESCPIPVLLSGGALTERPEDFLTTLKNCMDAGGHGCAVGRNLWQYKNPPAMLKAIMKLVHEDLDVEMALDLLK